MASLRGTGSSLAPEPGFRQRRETHFSNAPKRRGERGGGRGRKGRDLQQFPQVVQSGVHGGVWWEELDSYLHQLQEDSIGLRLVVQDHQQGGQEIAHTLGVTHIQVGPYVRAYNVTKGF